MNYKLRLRRQKYFENFISFLGLHKKGTDSKEAQETELRLILSLYIFFNILMYFIVPIAIFLSWLGVNVVIFIVLKFNFLEEKVSKRLAFRSDESKTLTFFEGGIYHTFDKVLSEKKEEPKKSPKQLEKKKEIYTIKSKKKGL